MKLVAIAALALITLSAAASRVAQENKTPPKPEPEPSFMARKLDHTNALLAGLAANDLEQVAVSANAFSLQCLDRSWQVIKSEDYVSRSTQFRRTLNTLEAAARKEKGDLASLQFLQLVGQCFDCHRALREKPSR